MLLIQADLFLNLLSELDIEGGPYKIWARPLTNHVTCSIKRLVSFPTFN